MKQTLHILTICLLTLSLTNAYAKELCEEYEIQALDLALSGKYEEALEASEKAIELDTYKSGWFYCTKGDIFAMCKRYEEALEEYDKATKLTQRSCIDNSTDAAMTNLGKYAVLTKLGRYEEALEAYDEAIESNHHIRELHYHKGVLLEDLGRHEEALKEYKHFTTDYIGFHLIGQEQTHLFPIYQTILKSYNRAISKDPMNAQDYYKRSFVLYTLGRYNEAIKSFSKSIELDPSQQTDIHYNIARLLFHLGRYEEAIREYNIAIERRNVDRCYNVDALYQEKGMVLYELGRYEEALQSFNEYIELIDGDPECYYYKSITLDKLGRHEEARVARIKSEELHKKKCEFDIYCTEIKIRLPYTQPSDDSYKNKKDEPTH